MALASLLKAVKRNPNLWSKLDLAETPAEIKEICTLFVRRYMKDHFQLADKSSFAKLIRKLKREITTDKWRDLMAKMRVEPGNVLVEWFAALIAQIGNISAEDDNWSVAGRKSKKRSRSSQEQDSRPAKVGRVAKSDVFSGSSTMYFSGTIRPIKTKSAVAIHGLPKTHVPQKGESIHKFFFNEEKLNADGTLRTGGRLIFAVVRVSPDVDNKTIYLSYGAAIFRRIKLSETFDVAAHRKTASIRAAENFLTFAISAKQWPGDNLAVFVRSLIRENGVSDQTEEL
jgi:hypothetical protein